MQQIGPGHYRHMVDNHVVEFVKRGRRWELIIDGLHRGKFSQRMDAIDAAREVVGRVDFLGEAS